MLTGEAPCIPRPHLESADRHRLHALEQPTVTKGVDSFPCGDCCSARVHTLGVMPADTLSNGWQRQHFDSLSMLNARCTKALKACRWEPLSPS